MTDLNSRHWALLAALQTACPQHVSQLARVVGMKPQQLNGFWQQMPGHIRGLLRQHDGQWRLVRPLAVFAEDLCNKWPETGFSCAVNTNVRPATMKSWHWRASRQIWRIRPCVWRISKPKAADGKGGVGSTDRANV